MVVAKGTNSGAEGLKFTGRIAMRPRSWSPAEALLLSCTYIWQFERICRIRRAKTGLKTEGTAEKQFDSRRLHHLSCR